MMEDPLWAPRRERSLWEQVDAVMGWYQWALLAGLAVAAIMCLLAWRGLKGRDELDRRPVPLPERRPARHRAEGGHRPPAAARTAWLSSAESQGWWIWNDEPPVR